MNVSLIVVNAAADVEAITCFSDFAPSRNGSPKKGFFRFLFAVVVVLVVVFSVALALSVFAVVVFSVALALSIFAVIVAVVVVFSFA